MLRFCLGVRVIFLLRALGGAMIGGDDAPGAKHNSFLRESLDVRRPCLETSRTERSF